MEFETVRFNGYGQKRNWLKFTPLEFETEPITMHFLGLMKLKFTPLEFETYKWAGFAAGAKIKIYSVGVWNCLWRWRKWRTTKLKFTPLEFETGSSVGGSFGGLH